MNNLPGFKWQKGEKGVVYASQSQALVVVVSFGKNQDAQMVSKIKTRLAAIPNGRGVKINTGSNRRLSPI